MNRTIPKCYTDAGFGLHDTGGGCMALRRNLNPWGLHILVTAQGNNAEPSTATEPVDAGLYAANQDHSEPLAAIEAENGEDMLAKISAGEWGAAS